MKKNLTILLAFVVFVAKQFKKEGCFDTATSLSYASMLSVVPLLAVGFAGFSSFPVFQEVLGELENFIFNNFIPTSSEVISDYIRQFIGKASKLTIVGMVSLVVIALLLMWRIDQALNKIWATTQKRDYLKVFLIYWAVLSLGPLLIGISLMATSYVTSLPLVSATADSIGIRVYILRIVAILFTYIAFSLTYLVIPNTRVNISHALIGGAVATLFFEVSKQGFALYISSNQTYQNIYGTLSTIPIFLIWIYISWLVILLGAMTSRCLDVFDFCKTGQYNKQNLFTSAFYIIHLLWLASKEGKSVDEGAFSKNKKIVNGASFSKIMVVLEKNNWVHKTQGNNWVLARDLENYSLWDLYKELPYSLPRHTEEALFIELVKDINSSIEQRLDTPLKKMFLTENKQA